MGMIIPMTPIWTARMIMSTTMTTNMGTAIVMTPSLDTITTMRTILTMSSIMGTATAMKPRMDMIMTTRTIMTTTMGRGSLMENVRHSGRTRLATKGRALA